MDSEYIQLVIVSYFTLRIKFVTKYFNYGDNNAMVLFDGNVKNVPLFNGTNECSCPCDDNTV